MTFFLKTEALRLSGAALRMESFQENEKFVEACPNIERAKWQKGNITVSSHSNIDTKERFQKHIELIKNKYAIELWHSL